MKFDPRTEKENELENENEKLHDLIAAIKALLICGEVDMALTLIKKSGE